MTNTKFRRRALISSVAMLLVAMLALGSATFAWYQADTLVHAQGMSFTTTATAGLKIAAGASLATAGTPAVGDYTTGTLTLEDSLTGTIKPVSLNQTTGVFYSTTGTGANNATMKEGATVTANATSYVQETLYFMQETNGEAATANSVYLTGVTINPYVAPAENPSAAQTAAAGMSSAIRVAVFHGSTVLGEFAISASSDDYFVATEDEETHVVTYSLSATKKTVAAAATGLNIDTGVDATQEPVAANSVVVRVYLDGFDITTTSNNANTVNAAALILNSIQLDFDMH